MALTFKLRMHSVMWQICCFVSTNSWVGKKPRVAQIAIWFVLFLQSGCGLLMRRHVTPESETIADPFSKRIRFAVRVGPLFAAGNCWRWLGGYIRGRAKQKSGPASSSCLLRFCSVEQKIRRDGGAIAKKKKNYQKKQTCFHLFIYHDCCSCCCPWGNGGRNGWMAVLAILGGKRKKRKTHRGVSTGSFAPCKLASVESVTARGGCVVFGFLAQPGATSPQFLPRRCVQRPLSITVIRVNISVRNLRR